MRRVPWAPAIAIAGALFVSVSLGAHDPITTKVTWTHDIARLFEARCVSCHTAGGKAPMPLTSYEEARPWARAIREEVLTRRMPKWHAARGYGEFANDPSLSPFEIATIAAWVDGGAPKGSPADAPANTAAAGKRPNPEPRAAGRGKGPSASLRTRTVACGSQAVSGLLTAVQPQLEAGGSVGIAALLPDGRRTIVAWIRDYDPEFPTKYIIRQGLSLPRGSRLAIEGPEDCRVPLTFLAPGVRP